MPLFLLYRRYERHCSCGHTWEVSRAMAGMSPPAMVAVNESDPRASGSDSLYEARRRRLRPPVAAHLVARMISSNDESRSKNRLAGASQFAGLVAVR